MFERKTKNGTKNAGGRKKAKASGAEEMGSSAAKAKRDVVLPVVHTHIFERKTKNGTASSGGKKKKHVKENDGSKEERDGDAASRGEVENSRAAKARRNDITLPLPRTIIFERKPNDGTTNAGGKSKSGEWKRQEGEES